MSSWEMKFNPQQYPHESVGGINWESVRRSLTSTWHRVTQTINYIISKLYNKLMMVDIIVLLWWKRKSEMEVRGISLRPQRQVSGGVRLSDSRTHVFLPLVLYLVFYPNLVTFILILFYPNLVHFILTGSFLVRLTHQPLEFSTWLFKLDSLL